MAKTFYTTMASTWDRKGGIRWATVDVSSLSLQRYIGLDDAADVSILKQQKRRKQNMRCGRCIVACTRMYKLNKFEP